MVVQITRENGYAQLGIDNNNDGRPAYPRKTLTEVFYGHKGVASDIRFALRWETDQDEALEWLVSASRDGSIDPNDWPAMDRDKLMGLSGQIAEIWVTGGYERWKATLGDHWVAMTQGTAPFMEVVCVRHVQDQAAANVLNANLVWTPSPDEPSTLEAATAAFERHVMQGNAAKAADLIPRKPEGIKTIHKPEATLTLEQRLQRHFANGLVLQADELACVDGITEEAEEIDPFELVPQLDRNRYRPVEHTLIMDDHVIYAWLSYDQDAWSNNPNDHEGNGTVIVKDDRDSGFQVRHAAGMDGNDGVATDDIPQHITAEYLIETLGEELLWDGLEQLGREKAYTAFGDVDNSDDLGGVTGEQVSDRKEQELCHIHRRAIETGYAGNFWAFPVSYRDNGSNGCSFSLSHGFVDEDDNAIWLACDLAVENFLHKALARVGWTYAIEKSEEKLVYRFCNGSAACVIKPYSEKAGLKRHVEQFLDELSDRARQEVIAAIQDEARGYAKSAVEEYDDWANGNVFDLNVHVVNRHTGKLIENDELCCGGYIGEFRATEALEDEIAAVVANLMKPKAQPLKQAA